MRKALQCLKEAEAYYANHPQEEAQSRSETLDYMTASYDALNRNIRSIAISMALLLAVAIMALLIAIRLKKTKKELIDLIRVKEIKTLEDLREIGDVGNKCGACCEDLEQLLTLAYE